MARIALTRSFRYLRHRSSSLDFSTFAHRRSTIRPDDVPIEEETIPGYKPEWFYPVNPGDLFENRYKIVAKVGWGRSSTVWLAQDTRQRKEYVALKVTTCNPDVVNEANHERDVNQRLDKNPSHDGYRFVRTMIDHFEVPGLNGRHICFVYEAMREPMWLFQRRWGDVMLPPSLVKVYVQFILRGLEYLHSECHLIHTDLKLDNILLGFEDPSVVEEYVQNQDEHPMPRKLNNARSTYLSHNDFGRLKNFILLPKITDFGLAQPGDSLDLLRHPIQPPLYHAPEVIFGTGWNYSADIWNLGVLIWNMMEGKDLFPSIRTSGGRYDARAHLAGMIALLGLPPKTLLDRANSWSNVKWDQNFPNPDGELCQTPREYYGGPFFDAHGQFLHNDLIPNGFSLEQSISTLDADDKLLFLNFVRKMLQWVPEDRSTPKELLKHAWLIPKKKHSPD